MVVRYKVGEQVLIIHPKYNEFEIPLGVVTDWWDLECEKYAVGEVVAIKKDLEGYNKKWFDLRVKVGDWGQLVPRFAVAPLREIKEKIEEWL